MSGAVYVVYATLWVCDLLPDRVLSSLILGLLYGLVALGSTRSLSVLEKGCALLALYPGEIEVSTGV